VVDVVNVRLWDPEDEDYSVDVAEKLLAAWNTSRWRCKVNASVGCLLARRADERYRYFHSSSNNATLLDAPRVISDTNEMRALVNDVMSMDLQREGIQRRPNTEWRLHAVTNVTFYVYKMEGMTRVGCPDVDVPDYLKKNRGLFLLVTNPCTGRPYDDRLCFFRCLAVAVSCRCPGERCVCRRAPERAARSL
jgi:hypothetical protein